ncbi:MAG: hypothetical protein ACI4W7_00595 [Candidatus Spyradenecus sp.]
MATPSSFLSLPAAGFILCEVFPGSESERPHKVYKGPLDTLSTWEPLARADAYTKTRIACSLAIDGPIAILTITDEGTDGSTEETPDATAGDIRTPTLTLSMAPFDRPIETIESPTNFAAITPKRILELRAIAQSLDTAAYEALTDAAEKAYVKLLTLGITHRQEAAYTCTVTRYIPLNTKFSATIPDAFKTCNWADIIDFLGSAKANYADPDSNLKWLPLGETITIKERRYAEVSINYQGAYYFPPELYE